MYLLVTRIHWPFFTVWSAGWHLNKTKIKMKIMVTTSAKLETTVHNQSMRLNWPCLCLWCFAQCMLWDRLQDDWSPMEWWKKACTMIAETTSCSRHFLKVRTIQTQTQSKHHPVLKSPYKWDKLARLWSAQAGCRLSSGLCWRYLPKGPTIVSYWSLSNTHPHTQTHKQ